MSVHYEGGGGYTLPHLSSFGIGNTVFLLYYSSQFYVKNFKFVVSALYLYVFEQLRGTGIVMTKH